MEHTGWKSAAYTLLDDLWQSAQAVSPGALELFAYVDYRGRVVVDTSTGRISAFNRTTSGLLRDDQLRIELQNPTIEIEAGLAVGANGWAYAPTRRFIEPSGAIKQEIAAIDFTQP